MAHPQVARDRGDRALGLPGDSDGALAELKGALRTACHGVSDDPVVSQLVMPLFEAERDLLAIDVAQTPAAAANLERVNPHVRPHLAAIEDACRRHHVTSSALFGSATQSRDDVVPRDLDVLVTFAPLEPRMKAEEYAALSAELEALMGMPVDVMVSTAIRNPVLAEEIERTKVVLYGGCVTHGGA